MEKISALHRPIISPQCYPDESPIGFLCRVATENQYGNYHWLIRTGDQAERINQSRLYDMMVETEWTGFDKVDRFTKEIYQMDYRFVVSGWVRYCPECLLEKCYWRAKWQLKYALTCLTHRIWLRDRCPICERDVHASFGSLVQCPCGAKITDKKGESAPQVLLSWQRFMEGQEEQQDDSFLLLLPEPRKFDLSERMKIGQFAFNWMKRAWLHPGRDFSTIRLELDTARTLAQDAADILFSGRAGYRAFLLRLITHTNNRQLSPQYGFVSYCRFFNQSFPDDRYEQLRKLNEEVVHCDWKKPLSRRNRTFSSELITTHQWIPFQVACRRYGVHKSALHRAIQDLSIAHQVRQKAKRDFVDVFEPDLKRKLYRIKDCITSKEAATILGLTKLQFSVLRESNYLKCVSPPRSGYNQEWQFSKDEILEHLEKLTANASPAIGEVFNVAQILQYYGGKFSDSLITLLRAIERGELRSRGTEAKSRGVRALLIDRQEFFSWYARHKRTSHLMSATQAAKLLGVNQEITYQLVNHGLLDHETLGSDTAKWITDEHIASFHKNYAFLAKLSVAVGLGARTLMSYLKGYEIFPVDHDTSWKLRQKVYHRSDLLGVPLFEELLYEGA